jgi:hypothetical protein
MSLNSNTLPAGGGSNIEPMNPGTYPARVVAVVDLGLQEQRPFQGKEKPPANEIALTYEFVDEFLKDEDGNDLEDKPRWLTEMMSIYHLTAEKANSTKRFFALDPKNVNDGDFSKLVDSPCMVTVVHNPKKDKTGVWENIGGVTAMREKDAKNCAPLVQDTIVFDLDEPDLEVFNRLPTFIKKKIKGGLEYEGSKLYDLTNGEEKISDEEEDVGAKDESPY